MGNCFYYLCVALHPSQHWRVRHVLYYERGVGGCRVQVRLRQTGVAPRVQLGGLCDGERLVRGLDEPGLHVEVDQLRVLEPLYGQRQVRVVDGVAPERGRVPGLHLVVLDSG